MNNYYNPALDNTPLSVFDKLENMIKRTGNPHVFRLHQGKTTFPPCAILENWQPGSFELDAHQHPSPNGIASLCSLLALKLSKQLNKDISPDRITITCGATHAISIVLKSILGSGDEVFILSPQWLFSYGLILAAGGSAVEAPVFLKLSRDPTADIISAIEPFVTDKTKALYFNTPNNPTGFSLTKKHLAELVGFASRNNLWLISDNAYENYDFTDEGFCHVLKYVDRAFSI
jgi:aspartate/methionine/tyrosine aminotransferase